MKTFEEKLERLEDISSSLRSPDMTLTNTLKLFEEGVKLAKDLEKEINRIDRKVEKLILSTDEEGKESTAFELFPELEQES